MEKKRLDLLLCDLGLVPSREQAKGLIMAGQVYVNQQKADKPGMSVGIDERVEVRGNRLPFVSRGGLKLDKAIHSFHLSLEGKIAMDIGASTGGLTDCMLQNGAAKVFSVDVGYGQLAWKLRNDPRVVNMERTNIRGVTPEQIGQELDFFSVDVSFISLCLVLPVAFSLLRQGGEGVCLIKPQFEAGRGKVGKKGVVREPEIHEEVIHKICSFVDDLGFEICGLDYSPVKGPEGNIEYLIYLKKSLEPASVHRHSYDIHALVAHSHEELNREGKEL